MLVRGFEGTRRAEAYTAQGTPRRQRLSAASKSSSTLAPFGSKQNSCHMPEPVCRRRSYFDAGGVEAPSRALHVAGRESHVVDRAGALGRRLAVEEGRCSSACGPSPYRPGAVGSRGRAAGPRARPRRPRREVERFCRSSAMTVKWSFMPTIIAASSRCSFGYDSQAISTSAPIVRRDSRPGVRLRRRRQAVALDRRCLLCAVGGAPDARWARSAASSPHEVFCRPREGDRLRHQLVGRRSAAVARLAGVIRWPRRASAAKFSSRAASPRCHRRSTSALPNCAASAKVSRVTIS